MDELLSDELKVARIIFDHFGGPTAFTYPSDLLESKYYGDAARSILAAISQLRDAPEGWKLVPTEPTEAMLKAGREAMWEGLEWSLEPGEGLDDVNAKPAYYAMLAAAPPSPSPAIRQDAVRRVRG